MKKRSKKVKPGKSRKAGNLARVGNAGGSGNVGNADKTARDGKADKSAKTEKPSRLKLMARGRADFEILSALMQDAIVPGEDMVWDRAGSCFVMLANRFCWDLPAQKGVKSKSGGPVHQRRLCAVQVHGVMTVRTSGMPQSRKGTLFNLLAIDFDDGVLASAGGEAGEAGAVQESGRQAEARARAQAGAKARATGKAEVKSKAVDDSEPKPKSIEMVFSGGGRIRFEGDGLHVLAEDINAGQPTTNVPRHDDNG